MRERFSVQYLQASAAVTKYPEETKSCLFGLIIIRLVLSVLGVFVCVCVDNFSVI